MFYFAWDANETKNLLFPVESHCFHSDIKPERPSPHKDVHTLISWACEYANVHAKKDFADVIRIMGVKIERLSWIFQVDPI